MSNQPSQVSWSYKLGTLMGRILDRTARAPDELYEVKLSTGEELEGKLSVQNQDGDHIVVTNAAGTAFVSIAHIVFVRPKKN